MNYKHAVTQCEQLINSMSSLLTFLTLKSSQIGETHIKCYADPQSAISKVMLT